MLNSRVIKLMQINGITIKNILDFSAYLQVGPKEVLNLTDPEFITLGVTTIGDKVKLRAACTAHMSAGKGYIII